VLVERTRGAALGWTPSLERCLERGVPYAWSVRAVAPDGPSDWADPLFFEITPRESAEELAAALEIVRRHLAMGSASGPTPTASEGDRERLDSVEAPDRAGPPVELPERAGTRIAASSRAALAASAGAAGAKVRVVGEVRTVDPAGEPRLWGRGRKDVGVFPRPITPGTHYCFNVSTNFRFGLSTTSVDWGSAADACPAGTWVCRTSDLVACDTTRPDSGSDASDCDGLGMGLDADEHWGWVEDAAPSNVNSGSFFTESGNPSSARTCWLLPVWCCWEAE
jgi:hypothetical protein